MHRAEPLDQRGVKLARTVAAGDDDHVGGHDITQARGRLERAEPGVVDDGPGGGGHEHALDARCGGEDLEGAHHVQRGEPGVEQVGNLHDFSVWPGLSSHKDTSLTMPAPPAAYRRRMDTQ